MLRETEIGREIMRNLKKHSFNQDFLIEVDMDDPLEYARMKVIEISPTYTDGYYKFPEDLKADNRVQVSLNGKHFISYDDIAFAIDQKISRELM